MNRFEEAQTSSTRIERHRHGDASVCAEICVSSKRSEGLYNAMSPGIVWTVRGFRLGRIRCVAWMTVRSFAPPRSRLFHTNNRARRNESRPQELVSWLRDMYVETACSLGIDTEDVHKLNIPAGTMCDVYEILMVSNRELETNWGNWKL